MLFGVRAATSVLLLDLLDRDDAAQARVPRLPHFAHAARAPIGGRIIPSPSQMTAQALPNRLQFSLHYERITTS
jgi:hypothetical protein